MPLKKDEAEHREQRRQVGQQNAQRMGDAQAWDETRSHRKDNKDDSWDKAQKYREHTDRPKPRKKSIPKGALGRLK